ncbi:MAG: CbtB-domain containing protein [Rhodospirillales bacterium]|jgi:cobalt transporter subunit CbtB|nr:CbtB-domain containing protein [Rhodospirillales bacterium]
MAHTNIAEQTVVSQGRTAQLMQAGFAAFLGLGLFTIIAFSSPAAIHNAAHDSRHGITVPCH